MSSEVREVTAATKERRALLTGLMFGAAGAVAFSGKAIIVKLSYRYGVDAVQVIMYRMLFALPMFALLAWWTSRNAEPMTRHDWLVVSGLGFSGYYLASFLDFAGLQYIGASFERLILYLNPTIVLILSVVLFRHRVSRAQWIALALSYAGVLVVFGHDLRLSGSNAALGAALVFASAISYAVYLVYSGTAVKRLGALRLSGLATTIACVLCIGQFFILRPPSAMHVAPEVIWLAILNATLCTFVPVLLVMFAIERIGASLTSQMGMIGPLSTILLSVWLLDEPFTLWIAMGTMLVISGVWWLARAPRKVN
ncbi:MAG TPA: DMT family transporter [Steroidobacteraceae bacterium]|nr:DMT family transporter [Steroidobacteraceae bacterium]